MESLTVPVRVFDPAEDSVALLLAGVPPGICICAAMSMAENVRNAIVFTTVSLVFIGIPLFSLVEVELLEVELLVSQSLS
jgi:hypothetical protein